MEILEVNLRALFDFFNNPNFAMGFATGFFGGCVLFEPFIINFCYFSNIALFRDIILTKKNREKLDNFYKGGKNGL